MQAIFLGTVTALGMEITITEMDVTDKGLPDDVALRDRKLADTYRRVLDIALARLAKAGTTDTIGRGDAAWRHPHR